MVEKSQKQKQTPVQREWADRLKRLEESGLDIAEFAAKEGVTQKRLAWWRWKFKSMAASGTARSASTGVGFVRVESKAAAAAAPIELVFEGGKVIRIPVGFDVGTLSQVLTVLEGGRP